MGNGLFCDSIKERGGEIIKIHHHRHHLGKRRVEEEKGKEKQKRPEWFAAMGEGGWLVGINFGGGGEEEYLFPLFTTLLLLLPFPLIGSGNADDLGRKILLKAHLHIQNFPRKILKFCLFSALNNCHIFFPCLNCFYCKQPFFLFRRWLRKKDDDENDFFPTPRMRRWEERRWIGSYGEIGVVDSLFIKSSRIQARNDTRGDRKHDLERAKYERYFSFVGTNKSVF